MIEITPLSLRLTVAGSAVLQLSAITFVPFLARTLAPLESLDSIAVHLRLTPALPPPPPPVRAAETPRKTAPRREFRWNAVPIASRPPELAVFEAPPPLETEGIAGGIEGGVPGGVMPAWLSAAFSPSPGPAALPPPPAPPPPAPAPVTTAEPRPPERIRVSSEIQQTMIVYSVRPEYPPMARQARIQGVVKLEAVVSREGEVTQLQVIEGHPLLRAAAETAVLQWRYRPATINGQPVEVITYIHVHFRLE